VTTPFNPQPHLIQLPRKVKDKATGHYITVYDDYLEVKWRLCWFRDRYPHGTIETEELCVDLAQGYARYKARVTDGEGGSATGHGTETKADFTDYCERAETRALGRALAAMGIGTQFVGAELDELPHVADAPVAPLDAPDVPQETTGRSHPLPVGEGGPAGAATPPSTNGHTPAPEPDEAPTHPTEGHLAALRNLAVTECGDPSEVYEDRLRTMMKIPKQASVSSRLLTKTMAMSTYMEIFAYYRRLEAQLAKGKEATGGTAPTTEPAPEPAPAATGEGREQFTSTYHPTPKDSTGESLPADPPSAAGSSFASVPSPDDAAERDRQRLRAEVAQWDLRVPPAEVEHVIQHNVYSKARALLWKCRREQPAPALAS